MPTLYVEDIPDDLYQALRKRARSQGRSVAAEVRALLAENIPTERELRKRRDFMTRLDSLRSTVQRFEGSFPTTEEMIRDDRNK